jgi:histone demethylase JARID1
MADSFESRWKSTCQTPKEKETEYWRIVEGGSEWVHVQYGSDLDVGKHGSGFPLNPAAKERAHAIRARHWLKARNRRRKAKPSEYMTVSGWNTNNLADSTFLHHLNESVAGVTRPMIYVGMLFSSFCWHTEDNYLYSINYLHTGSPKKWYGIPHEGAEGFEKCMRETLPELFEKTPNLLHLLVTQLSPRFLKNTGVPVYTALQKKGQFVITCPRAYHAGFNTGFNVAESVNFALEDWLPICRKAVNDYRYSRSAVVPYEEIVLKAAAEPDSPEIAQLVRAELMNVIHQEQKGLTEVFASGITQMVDFSSKNYEPCEHCGYDCFISGVVCTNHPNKIACLLHSKEACSCASEQKRLFVRVPLTEMRKTFDSLNDYLGENTAMETVHSPSNSSS